MLAWEPAADAEKMDQDRTGSRPDATTYQTPQCYHDLDIPSRKMEPILVVHHSVFVMRLVSFEGRIPGSIQGSGRNLCVDR